LTGLLKDHVVAAPDHDATLNDAPSSYGTTFVDPTWQSSDEGIVAK
jgi:hypothetical protein